MLEEAFDYLFRSVQTVSGYLWGRVPLRFPACSVRYPIIFGSRIFTLHDMSAFPCGLCVCVCVGRRRYHHVDCCIAQ